MRVPLALVQVDPASGEVTSEVTGEQVGGSSAWCRIDGDARVLHMQDAVDELVEYYRSISGEHPDWDEYRRAMVEQGKSVIVITPTRWGPISTGGFPESLFEDPDDAG